MLVWRCEWVAREKWQCTVRFYRSIIDRRWARQSLSPQLASFALPTPRKNRTGRAACGLLLSSFFDGEIFSMLTVKMLSFSRAEVCADTRGPAAFRDGRRCNTLESYLSPVEPIDKFTSRALCARARSLQSRMAGQAACWWKSKTLDALFNSFFKLYCNTFSVFESL